VTKSRAVLSIRERAATTYPNEESIKLYCTEWSDDFGLTCPINPTVNPVGLKQLRYYCVTLMMLWIKCHVPFQ